jgi:hypothetical protein
LEIVSFKPAWKAYFRRQSLFHHHHAIIISLTHFTALFIAQIRTIVVTIMVSLLKNDSSLTAEASQIVTAAAREQGESMNIPFNITIVDAHTNILSFLRMDGAKITSIDISQSKAFTSAGK